MSEIAVGSARANTSSQNLPTVSVLVKAYNHARYIRKTIESVLSQSFQDFEILVTDDGSTDDTLDVLSRFDDPRIHVKASATNQGISSAMNATLARARGRYLAILNSDDWALPGRLQRQVDFLDANPRVSLLFGLPRLVDEIDVPLKADSIASLFGEPFRLSDFSRRSWLRRFFFQGNCLCAPTAMIRREAYESVGNYDPRFTNLQDLDMWVRMLMAGFEIHWLPEEFTAFRIRDGHRNMSAPRTDTRLRLPVETEKILKHFTRLSAADFEEIFGEEAALSSIPSDPVSLRLAELALQNPWVRYESFALQTYYEAAKEPDDFRRLATLSGTLDVSNVLVVEELSRHLNRINASPWWRFGMWFTKIIRAPIEFCRARFGNVRWRLPRQTRHQQQQQTRRSTLKPGGDRDIFASPGPRPASQSAPRGQTVRQISRR